MTEDVAHEPAGDVRRRPGEGEEATTAGEPGLSPDRAVEDRPGEAAAPEMFEPELAEAAVLEEVAELPEAKGLQKVPWLRSILASAHSLREEAAPLEGVPPPKVTPPETPFEEEEQSPLPLDDVLDAVEADYQMARVEDSRKAPLLLATLAEAARVAGLRSRAERAYLEFQSRYPDSAYGFRDLGTLCHEQGRLAEAQAMLEHAVEVSPQDIDSRLNLALVYLDREMWDEAEQALDVITAQALTTLFRSRLFDPDLHAAWARLYLARGTFLKRLTHASR